MVKDYRSNQLVNSRGISRDVLWRILSFKSHARVKFLPAIGQEHRYMHADNEQLQNRSEWGERRLRSRGNLARSLSICERLSHRTRCAGLD
jgi:hypothetical protein